jgi:peptidyl-prolyl cis-trans isomerase A (cyclophilin A)
MARTADPNSATSEFFINVKDNAFLDPTPANPGYTVFGRVVSGMDVVDRIRGVQTATVGMYENVPVVPVVINSATIIK